MKKILLFCFIFVGMWAQAETLKIECATDDIKFEVYYQDKTIPSESQAALAIFSRLNKTYQVWTPFLASDNSSLKLNTNESGTILSAALTLRSERGVQIEIDAATVKIEPKEILSTAQIKSDIDELQSTLGQNYKCSQKRKTSRGGFTGSN